MLGSRAVWIFCLIALAACSDGAATGDEQALTATWKPKAKRKNNLRFATFNIRNFPVAQDQVDAGKKPISYQLETDQERLRRVLDALNADVIAVQEIWDGEALQKLLDRLAPEYRYKAVFAKNDWSPQHVGLIVNTSRLGITWVREHPEIDITKSMRSGLTVRLESVHEDGVDVTVMALHLASGESTSRAGLRLKQIAVAADIVEAQVAELEDEDYVVLGDLNTAKGEAEVSAIDEALASAGLARHKNDTGCSAYFAPDSKKPALQAAWIDHVYARGLSETDEAVPLLAGTHCAINRCEPFESRDLSTGGTYWSVSDHCPVYFEVADTDDDPAGSGDVGGDGGAG